MKLAGFSLLLAGWAIVLASIAILPPLLARSVFALAGVGIEALGLAFVTRAHMPRVEERPEGRR
jgi:hypothetical protein